MSWEAASVIVNMVLAIATFGIIYLNREQVKASQKQVEASQKQVEVSAEQARISREQLQQSEKHVAEAVEASQRPFLFPTRQLNVTRTKEGVRYFDFEQLDARTPQEVELAEIGLKNVGTGIAFNVVALLAQPRPENPVDLNIAPRFRAAGFMAPIPPGGEAKEPHGAQQYPGYGWDTYFGNDPRNSIVAPARDNSALPVVARLSIICFDVFGNAYVGQFDCYGGMWVFRWFGKRDSDIPGRVRLGPFEQIRRDPKPGDSVNPPQAAAPVPASHSVSSAIDSSRAS